MPSTKDEGEKSKSGFFKVPLPPIQPLKARNGSFYNFMVQHKKKWDILEKGPEYANQILNEYNLSKYFCFNLVTNEVIYVEVCL